MAIVIGTVTNLMGTATATAADGSIRQLNVGDKVFQNDLINTHAAGAIEIEFADGNVMALGRDSQALLDTEYFNAAESLAVTPEANSIDVDAIQQALLEGSDPTLVAQATAAGAGTQESEGGHDTVFIDYLAPETAVQAGFDTVGVSNIENNVPEFFLDDDDGLFLVDITLESGPSFVTPQLSGLPPETEVLPPVNDGDNSPNQQSPENTDGNNNVVNDTDDQLPETPPLDNDEGSQPGGSNNQGNPPQEESPDPDDQPSQAGPNGNNGFGNGDQDAPGNSGDNNNAENSSNSGQGNSGQGQQGNSNGQPEDEPLNAGDLVTEETEALFSEDQVSPESNNGHGNGDQGAPGNSGNNNNAENSDNAGQGNSGKGLGGGLGQSVNFSDIANSVLDSGGDNGLL